MKVGDLVRQKVHKKYGIIMEVLEFHAHAPLYYVVFWQCGNISGLYERRLEAV